MSNLKAIIKFNHEVRVLPVTVNTAGATFSHARVAQAVAHEFSRNNATQQITINLDGLERVDRVEGIDVKIVDLSFQALPRRNRTLQEVITRLKKCCLGKVPVVSMLWHLAVYPLALLAKVTYPGKIYDVSTLSFRDDPYGELSLIASLKEVMSALPKSDSDLNEIKEQIREGIDLSEGRMLAADWIQSAEIKFRQDGDRSIGLIPTGYWSKDGEFEPVFMAFYKKDGKLHLSEMRYGEDKGDHILDYVWNDFNPNNLQACLEFLLRTQTKSQLPGIDAGVLLKNAFMEAVSQSNDDEVQEPNLSKTEETVSVWREKVILLSGATPEPARVDRKSHVKSDPFTMIHETLRLQLSNAPLVEKCYFTLHLLTNHVQQVLKALPDMSREEKQKWLHRLKGDFERLEHKWRKAHAAQVNRGNPLEIFDNFSEKVRTLKTHIARIEGFENLEQTQRMQRLDNVQSNPFNINVNLNGVVAYGQTGVEQRVSFDLTLQDHQALQILKDGFLQPTQAKIAATLQAYQDLTNRMDALVEQRNYQAAIDLYRLISPHIPYQDEFFNALQGVVVERQDSTLFKEFSGCTSKICHYFWESKLRTGHLELLPDEWINYAVADRFMVMLYERRVGYVKRLREDVKALEEKILEGTSEYTSNYNEIPYELRMDDIYEWKSGEVISPRILDKSIYFNIFIEEHLRHTVDRKLHEKIEAIRAYYKYFDYKLKNKQEVTCARTINVLKANRQPTINIDDLWYRYFERGFTVGVGKLPDELVDIDRHRLMFTTMLHSKTSIGQRFCGLRGAAIGLQTLINSRKIERNEEANNAVIRKNFLDAIQDIQSWNGRIELATSSQSMMGRDKYGVVERGTSPNNSKWSLSEKGTSDIQNNYTSSTKHILHSRMMGSPDEEKPEKQRVYGASITGLSEATQHLMSRSEPVDARELAVKKSLCATDYFHQFEHNIHEVIDEWIQNPAWLDESQMVRRYVEILFKNFHLKDSINSNPEYFNERLKKIDQLLTSMKDNDQTHRYYTLLYFCSLIKHQFPNESMRAWPSLTNPENFKKAYEDFKASENLQNKLDYACYVLSTLATAPRAQWNENQVELLEMAEWIERFKDGLPMPVFGYVGVNWVKEGLAYSLEHEYDAATRDRTLDAWILQKGEDAGPGTWRKNGPVWEKNGSVIDLKNVTVLKLRNRPVQGMTMLLPNDVMEHVDYKMHFGDSKIMGEVTPGSVPGEIVIVFHRGDINYRLIWNKEKQSLIIEKAHTVERKRFLRKNKKEVIWLRFIYPAYKFNQVNRLGGVVSDELAENLEGLAMLKNALLGRDQDVSPLEERILKKGIWINIEKPCEGFISLDHSKELYTVEIDKHGVVKKVRTSKGYPLVNDESLNEVFSPLKSEKVIFVSKGNQIKEIRLLDQDMKLVRKNNNWVLKGHPELNGATWVTGKDIPNDAFNYLSSLGVTVEQLGFVVQKDGKTHFLLWPAQILGGQAHKLSRMQTLALEKQNLSLPPLKISFDQNGQVTGSVCSYLMLAYIHLEKHEYEKALYLIEFASKTRMQGVDKEYMPMLEEIAHRMSTHSLRGCTLKLKMILAIRKIMREQTQEAVYAIDQSEFLHINLEISQTFKVYKEKLSSTSLEHFQKQGEVVLSAEEMTELEQVVNESLYFAVASSRRTDDIAETDRVMHFSACSLQELKDVCRKAFISMQPPLPNQDLLEANLTLTHECVVGHFFELWNLIAHKRLRLSQLQVLFGPVLSNQNLEMLQASELDLARRALLTLAENIELGNAPSQFDRARLNRLHQRMPQSKKSLVVALGRIAHHAATRAAADAPGPYDGFVQELSQALDPVVDRLALTGMYTIDSNRFDAKEPVRMPGRLLSVEKLHDGLDRLGLSPKTTSFVRSGLQQSQDRFIPMESTITDLEKDLGLNLLTQVRCTEMHRRIKNLENKVRSLVPVTPLASDLSCAIGVHFLDHWVFTGWNSVVISHDTLTTTRDALLAALRTHAAGVDSSESNKLAQGVTAATQILERELDRKFALDVDRFVELKLQIEQKTSQYEGRVKEAKDQLISYLEEHKDDLSLPLEVRKAIRNRNLIGNEALLRILKAYYQTMNLNDDEADKKLTQLLVLEATYSVLKGKIADLVKDLEKQTIAPESQAAWIASSTQLKKLLESAFSLNRYCTEDGSLKDPHLYRKILACEAKEGIIVTDEQINLIKAILDRPNEWYELKVGLGKTSVILPIIMLMLQERGDFRAALVKEELLKLNVDSLDEVTRGIMERTGFEFSFSINDSCSVLILQEKYARILQCRSEGGYPVVSVSSMIALRQKQQLITYEIQKILSKYQEDLPFILQSFQTNQPNELETETFSDFVKISDLQMQIHLLAKINEAFPKIVIDEVDAIQDIISENNIGLGEPTRFTIELDAMIKGFLANCFTAEIGSKSFDLGSIILNQELGAIDHDHVKNELLPEALYHYLLSDDFAQKSGIERDLLSKINKESLLQYFCDHTNTNIPEFEGLTESQFKYLGALKHIIQVSLPVALQQNHGIEVGLKSDQFQVGPRVAGQEKTGVVYGDEYDLIINHYLTYAAKISNNAFTEVSLNKLKGTHSRSAKDKFNVYQWQEDASLRGISLIDYLNLRENWELRLYFLQQIVVNPGLIKLFSRQIVFNVQDLSYGKEVGGMTGTLNRDCLYEPSASREARSNAKTVSARVFLEAALLEIPTVEVSQKADMLAEMKLEIRDPNCKAIINQGIVFERFLDTRSLVSELRQESDRWFVFVDTTTRKFYIWIPGEAEPKEISKAQLNELRTGSREFNDKVMVYFAPPDTRGTDLRLPSGYAYMLVSDKCSVEDAVQSMGRMRGLGVTQSIKLLITSATAERIRKQQSLEKVDYAHVIADIKTQTTRVQEGKNLKAAFESIKRVVHMGTREMLFGYRERLDHDSISTFENPAPVLVQQLAVQKLFEAASAKDGWLEQEKSLDLFADYTPSFMKETKIAARELYLQEMAKIERLIQVVDGIKGLDPVERRRLIEHLDKMREDLANSLRGFFEKFDAVEKIYPSQIPSLGSGLPTAQAQVTQQQQQQQQQQHLQQQQQQQSIEKVPTIEYEAKISSDYFKRAERTHWFKAKFDREWGNLKPDSIVDPDPKIISFWQQIKGFDISINFSNMFFASNGAKGRFDMGRVYIWQDNVMLISRDDYLKSLKVFRERKSSSKDPIMYGSVYTLLNGQEHPEGMMWNLSYGDKPNITEDVKAKVLMAKLLLGVDQFNEDEKALLRKHLPTLNNREGLILHARHYGTTRQETLINELWP